MCETAPFRTLAPRAAYDFWAIKRSLPENLRRSPTAIPQCNRAIEDDLLHLPVLITVTEPKFEVT
jgi:hypothetical protein